MNRSVSSDSLGSSLPSSQVSEKRQRKPSTISQKFTFGSDGCREIEKRNMRIAARLEEIKRRPKPKNFAPPCPTATSAINRKRRDYE
ncbi:unnamed protein product, partial [Nesidiocoris tenuis]